MTKEEFASLRAGDLLLFPSGRVRTVIEGGVDLNKKRGPWNPSLCLLKVNNSWTRKTTTTRFYNDMPKGTKVIGHISRLCLRAEVVRLKHLGFDTQKELRKEMQDEIREAKRRGWKLCARALRFLKLRL